jgi:hypothetical protein
MEDILLKALEHILGKWIIERIVVNFDLSLQDPELAFGMSTDRHQLRHWLTRSCDNHFPAGCHLVQQP